MIRERINRGPNISPVYGPSLCLRLLESELYGRRSFTSMMVLLMVLVNIESCFSAPWIEKTDRQGDRKADWPLKFICNFKIIQTMRSNSNMIVLHDSSGCWIDVFVRCKSYRLEDNDQIVVSFLSVL